MSWKAMLSLDTNSITGEERLAEVTILQFLGNDVGLIRAVVQIPGGYLSAYTLDRLRVVDSWPSTQEKVEEIMGGKKRK